MIDERLYIDGVLVDIGTDTKITLDIKSNLFRDVSKIVSNNSYTVKLPKTVRNQMIFDHTDLVQANTDYPYLRHTARYFRNGVEVVKDGLASVLAVSDTAIEVGLVWGLYSCFSSLVSKGTTLNQLESDDRILFEPKNTPATYEEAVSSNFCYVGLDVWQHDGSDEYTIETSEYQSSPEGGSSWSGGGGTTGSGHFGGGRRVAQSSTTAAEDAGIDYLHPSVKVSYVLSMIKEQLGVDFRFTGSAKEDIESLILPLINKKSNALTFDTNCVVSLGEVSTGGGRVPMTITSGSNVFNESSGTVQQLTASADADIILDLQAEWQMDCTNWKPQGRGTRGDNYYLFGYYYLRVTVTPADGDATVYEVGKPTRDYVTINVPHGYKGLIKHIYTAKGKIQAQKGDVITIDWVVWSKSPSGSHFNGGTLKATPSTDGNVPTHGYYPIAYNLPKIKVIDFVKFLSAITGTFPLQMASDGVVEFVPLSTVWDNIDEAKDWTRRVVPKTGENKPKNLEFKMTDYCQHNYYKWKNDKWVTGSYDGDLLIPNETLSTERNIMEFPFSASDGNNVPMYKKSTTTGASSSDETTTEDEPEYSTCTDRILRLAKGSDGKAVGVFDINMQTILSEKYREVVNTLQSAKVVKETMRIRDIELLEFDETKPVYLAQYGNYFAIIEIKSEASGVAEVEMLKLDTY